MAYAIQKNTHQDTQSSTETQVREINQKKRVERSSYTQETCMLRAGVVWTKIYTWKRKGFFFNLSHNQANNIISIRPFLLNPHIALFKIYKASIFF